MTATRGAVRGRRQPRPDTGGRPTLDGPGQLATTMVFALRPTPEGLDANFLPSTRISF